MRIIIYMCCLLGLIFSQTAWASFNPHNTPHLLIDYTKTKSNLVRSKSPYTKYALVRFILDKGDDFSHLGGSGSGSVSFACPENYVWAAGKCEPPCDKTKYPFLVQPDKNKCESVSVFCEAAKHYGCTSCSDGYLLKDGDCIKRPCDGCLDSCPAHMICNEQKSGEDTKYIPDGCENGWVQQGSSCVENSCTGYTISTSNIEGCTSMDTCKKGATMMYKCQKCSAGWTLLNGSCTASDCSGYGLDYCPEGANCESCVSGNNTRYKITSCKNGYEESNGTCVMNDCTGYNETSSPANCKTSASCQKGTKTVYTCQECDNGWTKNGSACQVNSCTGYTETTSPANCKNATTCQKGTQTVYACQECENGWTKSGNGCQVNSCTGFGSTSSTIEGCSVVSATTCQKGNTSTYKCQSCEDGWTLNANGLCEENACEGFVKYAEIPNISRCVKETCKKGAITLYKCVDCLSFYYMDFDGLCKYRCSNVKASYNPPYDKKASDYYPNCEAGVEYAKTLAKREYYDKAYSGSYDDSTNIQYVENQTPEGNNCNYCYINLLTFRQYAINFHCIENDKGLYDLYHDHYTYSVDDEGETLYKIDYDSKYNIFYQDKTKEECERIAKNHEQEYGKIKPIGKSYSTKLIF